MYSDPMSCELVAIYFLKTMKDGTVDADVCGNMHLVFIIARVGQCDVL